MPHFDRTRRLTAEALGTGFLVAAVVGSGIMAAKLAGGNGAVALLCNTIPTGAVLYVIITIFGPISGAHFNPAVSLVMMLRGDLDRSTALAYIATQIIGGCLGTLAAHFMFDMATLQLSATARTGLPQWFAEFVATFGLLATILGCLRFNPSAVGMAVGLYITSAYWFTSSTSFANPAVTIARSISDTFAGISPPDVPAFLIAQCLGAVTAMVVFGWLLREQVSPARESAQDLQTS
jgi:glycerol uptake facilitator-like aquaporin